MLFTFSIRALNIVIMVVFTSLSDKHLCHRWAGSDAWLSLQILTAYVTFFFFFLPESCIVLEQSWDNDAFGIRSYVKLARAGLCFITETCFPVLFFPCCFWVSLRTSQKAMLCSSGRCNPVPILEPYWYSGKVLGMWGVLPFMIKPVLSWPSEVFLNLLPHLTLLLPLHERGGERWPQWSFCPCPQVRWSSHSSFPQRAKNRGFFSDLPGENLLWLMPWSKPQEIVRRQPS